MLHVRLSTESRWPERQRHGVSHGDSTVYSELTFGQHSCHRLVSADGDFIKFVQHAKERREGEERLFTEVRYKTV